ncbi:MAG TPA: hypothetical protein VFT13_06070 [Candidatus Krumholzibacteria bacterium]|nr:hypothetical protein [Candidatus Krumholzibacteria bacterium]
MATGQSYRFVSAPDSWNSDIGDVRKAVGWDPGEPNSINHAWRGAIDAVLDEMALRKPRFALVAGDIVQGEWDEDLDGYGTFGMTADLIGKRRAIRAAARTYYPQWRAPFSRHGLRVHAALGDHEIGDNWWDEPSERAVVATYKSAWSNRFTYRPSTGRFVYSSHPPTRTQHARTAYAFRSGPALFVSVDAFHQRPDGVVHTEVVGSQLRWLRRVLARARRDPLIRFVIVQGHAPALRAERQVGSSDLRIRGGESSRFWRTLETHDVDLYLCGESHAISTANRGGVEQVVHGSTLSFATFNYLTVAVSPTRLALTLRRAPLTRTSTARLWQVGDWRPSATLRVGRFAVVGTMTIAADGHEQNRRGIFRLSRHNY